MGLILGTVLGAGIFRTPSLVASNSGGEGAFLFAWGLGGMLSLVGALCYAELATAYPDAGGDYHFLRRAFGDRLAFLFAWARLAVIQTGSIALLAFIVGDRRAAGVGLLLRRLRGAGGGAAHRAQRGGIRPSSAAQNVLTSGVSSDSSWWSARGCRWRTPADRRPTSQWRRRPGPRPSD
jgi:amino acid transporter